MTDDLSLTTTTLDDTQVRDAMRAALPDPTDAQVAEAVSLAAACLAEGASYDEACRIVARASEAWARGSRFTLPPSVSTSPASSASSASPAKSRRASSSAMRS